jgi:hypothetical protein
VTRALQQQLLGQLATEEDCINLVNFDLRGRPIGSRAEATATMRALESLEKRGLVTTATFVHGNGKRRALSARVTPKGLDRVADLHERARAAAGAS